MDAGGRSPNPEARLLNASDGARVRSFVSKCPPLTVHTSYTYWFILSRTPRLSVGLEASDGLVAVALGVPTADGGVFVWQLASCPTLRRTGLAIKALGALWTNADAQGLSRLELTIAPSNQASVATMRRFADDHGLRIRSTGLVGTDYGVDPAEERFIIDRVEETTPK